MVLNGYQDTLFIRIGPLRKTAKVFVNEYAILSVDSITLEVIGGEISDYVRSFEQRNPQLAERLMRLGFGFSVEDSSRPIPPDKARRVGQLLQQWMADYIRNNKTTSKDHEG